MTILRHCIVPLLSLLLITGTRADPPVASYIFPAGGKRGTTVNIKVGGVNLHSRCGFELIGPGVQFERALKRTETRWLEGPILPLPESQQQEDYPKDMAGRVTIAAHASLGIRPGRLWTAQGASSGLAFVVGDLPEIIEQETDGPEIAQRVTLPVTINGRIFPREDVDEWAFAARKGQVINAEVLTGSLGFPLEARLEVRDAADRVLAENDPYPGAADARLRFTAPADGAYRLRIHDARFLGGQQYVYRLTLTEGVRPEVADTPMSDQALPLPAMIRGRLAAAGQMDSWRVELKKGQAYEIDLKARRIHSPLVPLVVVRDPGGKEAARYDAAQQNADPTLRFTPAADGVYRIEVGERFRARGGPAFTYHLTVAQPSNKPDFRLSLTVDTLNLPRSGSAKLKVTAERLGDFKGPIELAVEGLPPGVSAAKAAIAANQPTTEITLTATADALIGASRLTVRGTAKFSDKAETRTARAPVLKGSADVDSLLLAVTIPTPFVVKADYLFAQGPRGTVYFRKYRIERNGFTGPITVTLADRQARHLQGVTGPTLAVPPDKSEFEYPISMPPWMETGRTCRACIMAVGEVTDRDGSAHEVSFSSVEQNMQIIVVVEPGRLGLELERTSLRAEPGGEATLAFQLQRGEGLKGAAKVELAEIPGASAEPVTVAADQARGTIKLRFAKDGLRATTPAVIRATIMDGTKPVTAETKVEIVAK